MTKTVAVFFKARSPFVIDIGKKLFRLLRDLNITFFLDATSAERFDDAADGIIEDEIPEFVDLIIVLGGDGTLLRTARSIKNYNTPVVAVNLGHLGFLSAFSVKQFFDSFSQIIAGNIKISNRLMLHGEHFHNAEKIHSFVALNDVVINKATLARIIQLDAQVNGQHITSYFSDGLIVSTPTGSTAYNLAAGGPIIMPEMEAIVISPICPHTLTNRPIVLDSKHTVEVSLKSHDSEVLITVDGQIGFSMQPEDRVTIRRWSESVKLVQNPNATFFEVLQHKLSWGER